MPLIISWPAKIKEASVYPHLVSLTDLFATLCDLTGQEKGNDRGEDSFSFWPVLNGESDEPIRTSMVHNSSRSYYGIRSNGWKFIDGLGSGGFTSPATIEPVPNGPTGQLYHLKEDPKEANNLFSENPEIVQELKVELTEISN